jgi:NADPH:quinone reductase
MPYPRIVPHNDGAGVIEQVGANVPTSHIGERVWLYELSLPKCRARFCH